MQTEKEYLQRPQASKLDKDESVHPNSDEKQFEMDADISQEEMKTLEQIEIEPGDDDSKRVYLDNTDEDGTPLNEKTSINRESGDDLDVPGSELDDENEAIGEEDEENNNYSRADAD